MSTARQTLTTYREKFLRWLRLLITFFVGQGATQLLQMVAGIAIIHWLSKEQYATFALLLAFRGTSTVLMDLGFSGGLSALIGSRCHQPRVVGRYIAAARYYRNRLILTGAVVLLGVMLFASQRYGWGIGLGLIFWILLIVSIFYDALASFYSPIFYLQQRIKEVYFAQLATSSLRILLLYVAYWLNFLSAPVAIGIGGLQSVIFALFYVRRTVNDVEYPAPEDSIDAEKKEALQLTLPKIPGAVFYAIQGQVTIFIIGIFGQYNQIADMGALSRIAMIFTIPSALVSVLIAPWFAKLRVTLLARSYLVILSVFSVFAITLVSANAMFPKVFLYILGSGYGNLEREVFLFSILASLSLLSGLVYALNSSRKWVYYWTGPATIFLYIITLIVFLAGVDMTSISNVIIMSIYTMALTLCVNLAVSAVGFKRRSEVKGSE